MIRMEAEKGQEKEREITVETGTETRIVGGAKTRRGMAAAAAENTLVEGRGAAAETQTVMAMLDIGKEMGAERGGEGAGAGAGAGIGRIGRSKSVVAI